MCYFNRTTHGHIRLLRCNVLFVVYNNCPGQQDPQISRQLNTYRKRHDKEGIYSFSTACHNPCVLANTGARCLGQSIAGWLWHLYNCLHARIHASIAARRGAVYLCDCLGTPYCDVCFIWSEFIIIYSYNDKLPVLSNFNTMNLFLKVLLFFFSSVFP